ncbi:MAG: MMPL family transporter, partial [Rikenellaceae bacterium]
ISYGRIELTLMAFVPMALSWVIILGLMAIFGLEFNIVNIILSTFIFGIGDDFSIFVMDGLLSEYRNGKKMLASHKTAIFFSVFTTIVGIGVLIFAKHPVLHSISTISILGMVAVVLISFTVQPIIFRIFISSQTKRGGFPFTLFGLLNSLYAFFYFITGCFLLQFYILILLALPIKMRCKKEIFHRAVSWSTHFFLRTMITAKMVNINTIGET